MPENRKKTDMVAKKSTAIEEKKSQQVMEKKANGDEAWYQVRPTFYTNFDSTAKEFQCEVHLPGVKKEDVKLRVLPELFDLKAKREHVLFTLTEYFPCNIDPSTLNASYDSGLLRLKGRIQDPLENAIDIPLQ